MCLGRGNIFYLCMRACVENMCDGGQDSAFEEEAPVQKKIIFAIHVRFVGWCSVVLFLGEGAPVPKLDARVQ